MGCQRDKWDMDKGHFYFDGAGKAMLPRASVGAGVSLVQSLSKPWTIPGLPPEQVGECHVDLYADQYANLPRFRARSTIAGGEATLRSAIGRW